jgi:GTPase
LLIKANEFPYIVVLSKSLIASIKLFISATEDISDILKMQASMKTMIKSQKETTKRFTVHLILTFILLLDFLQSKIYFWFEKIKPIQL